MVGSDTMVVVSSSRPTPPGSATTATAKEEREVPSKGITAPTSSMAELLARGGNSGDLQVSCQRPKAEPAAAEQQPCANGNSSGAATETAIGDETVTGCPSSPTSPSSGRVLGSPSSCSSCGHTALSTSPPLAAVSGGGGGGGGSRAATAAAAVAGQRPRASGCAAAAAAAAAPVCESLTAPLPLPGTTSKADDGNDDGHADPSGSSQSRRAFFLSFDEDAERLAGGVGRASEEIGQCRDGGGVSAVETAAGRENLPAAGRDFYPPAAAAAAAAASPRAAAVAGDNAGIHHHDNSDGEKASLSQQVESLLARVEFLEKQRSFEGAGVGCRGSGSLLNNRRGSEVGFLQEEHPGGGGDRGAPPLILTPPPRLGGHRAGGGEGHHAVGVSTTPFTGLDVLFRTPKQPQESAERYSQHVIHPPLSPSRGKTRWAAPRVPPTDGGNSNVGHPESPRRSRLTWCAGDGQEAIEARGGRAPPRAQGEGPAVQQPPSPPLYSLGDARGKWALEARSPSDLGGDGRSLSQNAARDGGEGGGGSRPRSATEGVAGGGDGAGGERGRSLFSSDRHTRRSDHETYSPDGSTKRGSPRHRSSPRSPRKSSRMAHRCSHAQGEQGARAAGSEAVAGGEVGGDVAADGGGAGAFAEGGVAAGPISLLGYLRVEVFGAEDHGVVDTQANRTVRNFLTVPRQLERLLLFGMLVCLDTFLYVTTFLPIRIVIGVVSSLFSLLTRRRRPSVNRPLVYDWMRGATFAAALGSLQFLEMSRVYHYIRGQAMVKLYVLIAMVEIFDKLMCSFGQDALDSLYLSTVHKKKRRVLVHFTIVCVTACLHSLLLFVHVTTLTVAVNSSDQALLTLLISNNFAEIKSSVFKKFDKHNLFQLSCHDVVERFKLALFLAMIMLLNVCQGGLDDPVAQFSVIFAMVFGGEVLADWIKHGFIIKFNQLTPSIYDEYSTILARDVAAFRKDDGSTLDHTHFVARRLAFATVPLNCVMIRFVQMAVPKLLQRLPDAPPSALWVSAILFYLMALALKVLTGIKLMADSCTLHPEAVISSSAAASWLRSPVHGAHKTRKELSLEKLSTIERFTLWKGRIV
ncbi:conserved unknown protein [Ectocarpus siliculosus]|uniref:Uncharacterized protein n=1 Tax=Ectocarpus siliculosus TaxID=2880 RepID=D7FP16_ECTSI|nr:conserved unknown protein [Ectocarpus siliculosus]|eukprot:CBJ30283.1 conserved unknown protein [Ectocarpus siliculosus]